jgi:hypothetical protein
MTALIKERILSAYQAVSAFDGTPCRRRPKLLCTQGGKGSPYYTLNPSHWFAFVYEPVFDENGKYHKEYAYSFGVDGPTEEDALTRLLDWLKQSLVEHEPSCVC